MDASIERIAQYALDLDYAALPAEVVHQAKRRIVDTLGCALGGYDAAPCRIARTLAARAKTDRAGARILGTRHVTLPELAAFANGVMARYLDGNDTFPGGGGHPSDVIAPMLAMAEATNSDGRALIAAVVLAYEVYAAMFEGACMRDRGMDHVLYTAVGAAVGAGKLLGLERGRLGQAVALAVTPNIALHCTRRGDLSMWKGVAAGNGARNGVFAALLAAEGMTGPEGAIEGSHGLRELVGRFELGELAGPDGVFKLTQSNIKFYLSEYHSQAPITAALQLADDVRVSDIAAITVHTYWFCWSEIGSEPEKWHPTTRESADHSLPHILAAVLTDRAFSDAIFSEQRIRDPELHALADKVSVVEDPEFTRRFSADIPCRIEIRMQDGTLKTAAVDHPRGHYRNPMSDAEVAQKFRALAGRKLAAARIDAALQAAWRLDSARSVAAVMDACCLD
jgi:2-methylcitrate dehydratase